MLRKTKSVREQAIDLMAPSLKIHFGLIFAHLLDETYSSYSLPLLVLVLALAPLVSLAIAIAAWTAACFWFFTAIIGDPDGVESEGRNERLLKERDGDGKTAILTVRKWWRKWLVRALR